MMYSEFVEMSGLEISYEQYTKIVEPMYTAVEDMSKQEFIEFIAPSVKALIKSTVTPKGKSIKKMVVRDNSGCRKNAEWMLVSH